MLLQDIANFLRDTGTVTAVRMGVHGKAWVQMSTPEEAFRALDQSGRVGTYAQLALILSLTACRGLHMTCMHLEYILDSSCIAIN